MDSPCTQETQLRETETVTTTNVHLEKEKQEDAVEIRTLTCEICYEEIDLELSRVMVKPLIFQLGACGHTFCRDCFQETFHSMIMEQNRHDDLRCPFYQCEARPTPEEIELLVSSEVFKKYQRFQNNQRVARDRENLMFCIKPDCDNVICLNEEKARTDQQGSNKDNRKQSKRLITCSLCKTEICRDCRQAFHGEDSKCVIENQLEEWQNNLGAIELSNCPKCHSLIEKNEGCPEMTCYVCKFRFCWICGLHSEHIFHKIQIDNDETGALCVFINHVLEYVKKSKTGIKCLPIVYLLLFIICCAGPVVLLAVTIVGCAVVYWFFPFYYMFTPDMDDCLNIEHKCCSVFVKILLAIIMYPILLVFGAISLFLALLSLAVYYVIGLFLILRMCYQ